MQYDGRRLLKVPLFNICGLGYSWPLAECRAGALALLVPALTPILPLDLTDASAAEDFGFERMMLRRIDTADDAHALATCAQQLAGSATVCDAIRSRQQSIEALHKL